MRQFYITSHFLKENINFSIDTAQVYLIIEILIIRSMFRLILKLKVPFDKRFNIYICRSQLKKYLSKTKLAILLEIYFANIGKNKIKQLFHLH